MSALYVFRTSIAGDGPEDQFKVFNKKIVRCRQITVNPRKHKAFQEQLPRTAWYSWQFERSALSVFYSSERKTKQRLKQMCKGSAAKAAHNLVCSWRKYSCRPCTWHWQPPYNHQYLSRMCCQCCHCKSELETQILVLLLFLQIKLYLCLDSYLKVTFISIQQPNIWPSVIHTLFPIFPINPLALLLLQCHSIYLKWILHIHQLLTDWRSTSLLSLSPSNALTFITTTSTNFVTMACCTRITGNNVGIRGEA